MKKLLIGALLLTSGASYSSDTIFTACEKELTLSSNEIKCIKKASSVAVVKFCGDRYATDAYRMACIIRASKNGSASVGVINACVAAFTLRGNEENCVGSGVSTGLLEYCDGKYATDGMTSDCITSLAD